LRINNMMLQKYNGCFHGGKCQKRLILLMFTGLNQGEKMDFKRFIPGKNGGIFGFYWPKPGGNPQAGANRVCTETGTPRNGTGFPVLWDYDCLPDRLGRQRSPRLSTTGGWRGGVGDPLFLGRGTPNYSIFPYLSPAHFQITIGGRNID
jgi:hypothetical protein